MSTASPSPSRDSDISSDAPRQVATIRVVEGTSFANGGSKEVFPFVDPRTGVVDRNKVLLAYTGKGTNPRRIADDIANMRTVDEVLKEAGRPSMGVHHLVQVTKEPAAAVEPPKPSFLTGLIRRIGWSKPQAAQDPAESQQAPSKHVGLVVDRVRGRELSDLIGAPVNERMAAFKALRHFLPSAQVLADRGLRHPDNKPDNFMYESRTATVMAVDTGAIATHPMPQGTFGYMSRLMTREMLSDIQIRRSARSATPATDQVNADHVTYMKDPAGTANRQWAETTALVGAALLMGKNAEPDDQDRSARFEGMAYGAIDGTRLSDLAKLEAHGPHTRPMVDLVAGSWKESNADAADRKSFTLADLGKAMDQTIAAYEKNRSSALEPKARPEEPPRDRNDGVSSTTN